VIAPADLRTESSVYGPWSFLNHDDYRTAISFVSPLEIKYHADPPSTEMHANYFRVQPIARHSANAYDYLRSIATSVVISASNATPVDTEFWAHVFPCFPSQRPGHVLRITYVTAPRSRFEMELAQIIIPSDSPALELVFSARHAFVPASSLERPTEAAAPPSALHEDAQTRSVAPLETIVPAALPSPTRSMEHVAAFQRLREALPLTDDELALVVGVGRTTPYKWNREGSSPQPKTRRLLLRLDAIVRGLLASQDRAEFDQWLLVGDPAPIQLLRDQAIEIFERLAHAAIFKPASQRSPGYDLDALPLPQRSVAPPSIAPRRAKVSLVKRDR
jgi:DNA-binding XRE family transcriptional regulator